MRISEIFESIQGEGRHTGVSSIFVRTSGCNLRCWFCDTPYTSWQPEGETMGWQDVLAAVDQYESKHVVLTGGEPLLHAELVALSAALRKAGKLITVETAGTIDLPIEADLMSISPKMSNSTPTLEWAGEWQGKHERTRSQPQVIQRMLRDYDCQFKFVIDRPSDIEEVEAYLSQFPELKSGDVWLMPQGVTAEELAEKTPWIEAQAKRRGFHLCQRLHIEMFGNVRGK